MLLDRSLVLGGANDGVYLHDVVRDFGRKWVEPDELWQHQRQLVRLLLAAKESGGWLPPSDDADAAGAGDLSRYVCRSLRFHFTEAIAGRWPLDDEVLGWLEVPAEGAAAMESIVLSEAANAVGGDLLVKLADEPVVWLARRLSAFALRLRCWALSFVLPCPVTCRMPPDGCGAGLRPRARSTSSMLGGT